MNLVNFMLICIKSPNWSMNKEGLLSRDQYVLFNGSSGEKNVEFIFESCQNWPTRLDSSPSGRVESSLLPIRVITRSIPTGWYSGGLNGCQFGILLMYICIRVQFGQNGKIISLKKLFCLLIISTFFSIFLQF